MDIKAQLRIQELYNGQRKAEASAADGKAEQPSVSDSPSAKASKKKAARKSTKRVDDE